MRTIECENGTIYANADDYYMDVEELIEFLEQFKGRKFYNGAAESLSFRIDDEYVHCDSIRWFAENEEDDNVASAICDALWD